MSRWSPYYRRYYRYPSYYKYYRYPYYQRYNRYRWSPHYYRYLCDRYYNYRYSPSTRRYYFDDLYLDLKYKMNMFKSFLDSLPKNRSEMVNDLEIPDDVLKNRPYTLDDELSSVGSASSVCSLDELKPRVRSPASTDSSISLSRAMTVSEIDYDLFKRYKNRNQSEPFYEMKHALRAFPEEYLVALNDFSKPSPEEVAAARERPLYNEDLIRRMRRYYDDCTVFSRDDPGLLELEEALDSINLKTLDLDLI